MNIIDFPLKIGILFDLYCHINTAPFSAISTVITDSLIMQLFFWLNAPRNIEFQCFLAGYKFSSAAFSTLFFNYFSFALATRAIDLGPDCSQESFLKSID